jgi:hypothetical protein
MTLSNHPEGDQLSQVMAHITQLETQTATAEQFLASTGNREEAKAHVLKLYQRMGVEVDPTLVDLALAQTAENSLEFQPAPSGFKKMAATTYAMRNWIGTRVVLPMAIITGIGYGAVTGAGIAHENKLQKQELRVETQANALPASYTSSLEAITAIQENPIVANLVPKDAQAFASLIDLSEKRTQSAQKFISTYVSDGDSENVVTRENMDSIDSELRTAKGNLDAISENMYQAKTILRNHGLFIETGKKLDELLGSLDLEDAPLPVSTKVQKTYAQGKTAIQERTLVKANAAYSELVTLQNTLHQYPTLVEEFAAVYDKAQSLAIGALAKEEVAGQETLGLRAQEAVDLTALEKATDVLQGLTSILNAEYDLNIINRPGVKTGFYRDYRENNRTARQHYVTVEALLGGQPQSMSIVNAETGRAEKVLLWGEAVSEQVFERIKGDKMDNGILDSSNAKAPVTNNFGYKPKGYLDLQMKITDNSGVPISRGGQVTKW